MTRTVDEIVADAEIIAGRIDSKLDRIDRMTTRVEVHLADLVRRVDDRDRLPFPALGAR